MNRVGGQLAHQVLLDFNELRPFPRDPRILVLAGKGHNGGDALLAGHQLLKARPRGNVFILQTDDPDKFKPNTRKAFDALAGEKNARVLQPEELLPVAENSGFDISLDGLFGMQFTPPFRPPLEELVPSLNAFEKIGFRAAVDLPSGLGDQSAAEPLRADFTYATGIPKAPIFKANALQWTGRIRHIDIGFFDGVTTPTEHLSKILTDSTLAPLRRLRHPDCDKRSFGHLFLLGGSATMPGAILMATRAALRSGAGLVTAFVPESFAAQFAAAAPEAMWVPWPETPDGGLSLEGQHILREKLPRANAMAIGPGMGIERETQVLVQEILKTTDLPVVLDADALQPASLDAIKSPAVLTPHLGEMTRLLGGKLAGNIDEGMDEVLETIREFSATHKVTTLLKGPLTWITDGASLHVNTFGSPVLARGGSGDLLTGLLGGLLAQGQTPFEAAGIATVWHGMAAEHLARNRGQTAATSTLLLNYLHEPIRP